MRTNIEIDDKLMKEAQRLSGLKTKRAVIDAALRMFVRVKRQSDILKLAGKVEFWDDFDDRKDRSAE
jgi:Arc/MetJ family transcription regulator